MHWVDRSWISRLTPYLEQFTWKSDTLANFRCPLCGDSQKDKLKCRGYLFIKNGDWQFKCHNCGRGYKFRNFLYNAFPEEYKAYRMEVMRERATMSRPFVPQDTLEKRLTVEIQPHSYVVTDDVLCVADLPEDHPARVYMAGRKVTHLDRVFYTDNFSRFIKDELKIQKYHDRELPESEHLIFLLKDRDGITFGCQGREIKQKNFKTMKWNDNMPGLYGLEANDSEKLTLVFEGIFCSLLVPNSIAMLGASINEGFEEQLNMETTVLVFDNEPRHPDTVKRMEKAINFGWNVAFWPIDPLVAKDLNDVARYTDLNVRNVVRGLVDNAKRGTRAKIALAAWQRT